MAPTERWRSLQTALIEYAGLTAVLAGLVIFFSLKAGHFLDRATFVTIANQIPAAVIIAVGMTFVLIAGEIDLSVGSVLGVSGATLGLLMVHLHQPLLPAVLGCLAVGLACGAVNGLVTTAFRLPSFIVTLGMLEIARGGSYWVTDSQTQYIGSPIAPVASTTVFGLSLPFGLALLLVVVGQIVLSRTVFGRHLVAAGTNAEAARLAGIAPRRLKFTVLALSGLLAALAAVIDTSRFQSADPNAGIGFELQAIAAVVIGGTSLLGGRGSVVSSLFGVLIIAVLGAGLAALGVKDEVKRVVTGCVIIVAVILDQYRGRLKTPTISARDTKGKLP
ncbi:MAG: ABC transporter permease [Armatimonadetes bacterium]|nr:ABC transporter permease [Armatimonadota bacterium]